MDQAPFSSLLWAMHPAFLDATLKQAAIEAMMPDALRALAGFAAGEPPARQVDPIRDGATLILPIVGMLAPRGLSGTMYYEAIADRVREAAADNKVGAIVLSIRSPGGYVWGCAEAGDAIYEARAAKPVIAVADPFCFSAAHWLACQASAFYCTTSGEVGSMGVRSGHTDMSGFEAKIGMRTTLIASWPDKIAGHPYAPLSDGDRAEMQAAVDACNRQFTAAVARGRGLKLGDVARVHGTGKTFTARTALAHGAIDGVATLRNVVGRFNNGGARLSLMRRKAASIAMAAGI